ncbi:DUF2911 domain-containing protein [uncultured Muriicola sp.]|uniref:DUF2911 domain-containing protein n=1 Tax=uncultured Muriicola sp. TaxID=1583102 RepID=UPI00262B78F6|nr:DUF2911 domain-containing protein [uncultured Muriicola sp.]
MQSQLIHPKASPFSKITQDIGLTTILIEYSRPAARGRQIFGRLVPYGRIWRVGANESTKFTVNSEIEVLGNTLLPGTYALYAFPEEFSWEVVFHKNTSHWGDGRTAYDPSEDAFRVHIEPEENSEWQENFLISFDSISHNGAIMQWKWGNTTVSIPLVINTQKEMMHAIEKSLDGNPSAQTYYEAARYLQEEEIEYTRALHYLEKAIVIGGDTYYFYRVKSLVEASLKNYQGAIKSAQRSLVLAQAEGKDEFVRMNQENIARWKKLK